MAKEIKKKNPHLSILYFGDTARVPWGNKSPKTIQKYAEEISRFLIAQGAEGIFIACNTASALAFQKLKKLLPEVPIFSVIDPVTERMKKEFQKNPRKKMKIGVIGTRATISSGIYQKKLKFVCPQSQIHSIACPLLVPIVEESWQDKKVTAEIIAEYLAPLKKSKIDYLILGCTHYPLLLKNFQEFFGKKVQIINSAEEAGSSFSQGKVSLRKKSQRVDQYFFSDLSPMQQGLAKRILQQKVVFKKVDDFFVIPVPARRSGGKVGIHKSK